MLCPVNPPSVPRSGFGQAIFVDGDAAESAAADVVAETGAVEAITLSMWYDLLISSQQLDLMIALVAAQTAALRFWSRLPQVRDHCTHAHSTYTHKLTH